MANPVTPNEARRLRLANTILAVVAGMLFASTVYQTFRLSSLNKRMIALYSLNAQLVLTQGDTSCAEPDMELKILREFLRKQQFPAESFTKREEIIANARATDCKVNEPICQNWKNDVLAWAEPNTEAAIRACVRRNSPTVVTERFTVR